MRWHLLLMMCVVLALVVAAADRSGLRWDASADRRFTVSESLRAILNDQHEKIDFVGIWPAELDSAAEPITNAMTRIVALDGKFAWRRIDPILHKPALAEFAARFHEAEAPAVYVTRGERAFKITVTDRTRLTLQQEIGGALIALADPHPTGLAVVQGHGELRPGGGEDDGADRLLRAWELAGFRVRTCDLGRDPPRADEVVALLGATAPFGAADTATIARHLDDGGAALVLGDDRTPTDLAALLRARGVVVGGLTSAFTEAMRIDPRSALTTDRQLQLPIIVSRRHFVIGQESAYPEPNLLCDSDLINPDTPVSSAVQRSGRGVVSPYSTPLTVLDPAQIDDQAIAERLRAAFTALKTPPFSAVPVLRTAPADAWLKERSAPLVVPADLSKRPAYVLAWQIAYQPTTTSAQAGRGARLVAWSSRQAASNGMLGQERFANAALLTQAARWLADRREATAIPEAETAVFRVDCSDSALNVIMALLAALMPCLCIGGAMIAWWERR